MATPRGDRDVSCSSVTDISESCGGERGFYRGHREGTASWWGHDAVADSCTFAGI